MVNSQEVILAWQVNDVYSQTGLSQGAWAGILTTELSRKIEQN